MHDTDSNTIAHKQLHKVSKSLSMSQPESRASSTCFAILNAEFVKAALVAALILTTVVHMDPSNAAAPSGTDTCNESKHYTHPNESVRDCASDR